MLQASDFNAFTNNWCAHSVKYDTPKCAMPCVVIGAGLTAVDAASDILFTPGAMSVLAFAEAAC